MTRTTTTRDTWKEIERLYDEQRAERSNLSPRVFDTEILLVCARRGSPDEESAPRPHRVSLTTVGVPARLVAS